MKSIIKVIAVIVVLFGVIVFVIRGINSYKYKRYVLKDLVSGAVYFQCDFVYDSKPPTGKFPTEIMSDGEYHDISELFTEKELEVRMIITERRKTKTDKTYWEIWPNYVFDLFDKDKNYLTTFVITTDYPVYVIYNKNKPKKLKYYEIIDSEYASLNPGHKGIWLFLDEHKNKAGGE